MAEADKTQTSNTQESPQTSVAFNLFVYRKELSRQKRRHVRLSKAKLDLTEGLVSNNAPKAKDYNNDELNSLTRGVIYKQKLKRNLAKFSAWMKVKMEQKLAAEFVQENCKVVKRPENIKCLSESSIA